MIAAGIAAAGGLASGLIGSSASKSAASKQAAAAQAATDLQRQEFQQTQANMQPWMQAGGNALAQWQKAMGIGGTGQMDPSVLTSSPGYQFQMGQGTQAVNNAASAHGGVNSGNTLKALTQYGQGLANNTWQQYLQQLQGMSNTGLNAAGSLGNFGAGYASNAGNTMMAGANASAAGTMGSANAIGGGINSLGQTLMDYLMMQQRGQGQQQPTAAPVSLYGVPAAAYGGMSGNAP